MEFEDTKSWIFVPLVLKLWLALRNQIGPTLDEAFENIVVKGENADYRLKTFG